MDGRRPSCGSWVLLAVLLGLPRLGSSQPLSRACSLAEFVRGDANASGELDISDAVSVLSFLFRGTEAPLCESLADANASGELDLSDAISLLSYLFRGGPGPSPLSEPEAAACEDVRARTCGEALFFTPDPLGNEYSCGGCHGTESAWVLAADGPLRPGHGLGDAARRPSYFLGAVETLPAAVNRCREDWMDAPALDPDARRLEDLTAFIASLADGQKPAPALAFEIAPPLVTGPATGDPVAGCELFARACESCHGRYGAGTAGLGPSLWNEALTADRVRAAIRLSGPSPELEPGTLYEGLLGNRMPFFSRERLGDAEVEHVAAYVQAIQDRDRRPCDRTGGELQLIRGGTFRTFDHGVRGEVEQWSDRTIVLRDFFYDGLGPEDVLVWLYFKTDQVDAILSGRRISEHIARETPYVGETLAFRIPEDISDDQFNTVAIWCTLYEQNYGEAFLFD